MTTCTNDPLCVAEEFAKELPPGDSATLGPSCGVSLSVTTNGAAQKDSSVVGCSIVEDTDLSSLDKVPEVIKTPSEGSKATKEVEIQGADNNTHGAPVEQTTMACDDDAIAEISTPTNVENSKSGYGDDTIDPPIGESPNEAEAGKTKQLDLGNSSAESKPDEQLAGHEDCVVTEELMVPTEDTDADVPDAVEAESQVVVDDAETESAHTTVQASDDVPIAGTSDECTPISEIETSLINDTESRDSAEEVETSTKVNDMVPDSTVPTATPSLGDQKSEKAVNASSNEGQGEVKNTPQVEILCNEPVIGGKTDSDAVVEESAGGSGMLAPQPEENEQEVAEKCVEGEVSPDIDGKGDDTTGLYTPVDSNSNRIVAKVIVQPAADPPSDHSSESDRKDVETGKCGHQQDVKNEEEVAELPSSDDLRKATVTIDDTKCMDATITVTNSINEEEGGEKKADTSTARGLEHCSTEAGATPPCTKDDTSPSDEGFKDAHGNGREERDTEANNAEKQATEVKAEVVDEEELDKQTATKVSPQLEPEAMYRLDPPCEDDGQTNNEQLRESVQSSATDTNDAPAHKPDPPELERQRSEICVDDDVLVDLSCNETSNVSEAVNEDPDEDVKNSNEDQQEEKVSRDGCKSETHDKTEAEGSATGECLAQTVSKNPCEEEIACDGDDDDYSYEEIVLDDEEEIVEYVDEILDEYEDGTDESFTEVTYDSKDGLDDVLQQSRGSITVESSTKRPVIKSSTQKALEQEEARKRKEAEETRKNMEFRLARQQSFAKKDADLKRRLAEEEARHIQEEEERERRRVAEQERLAEIRAQEAAARIAQQQTAELRRRLEEEEARRKMAEAEAHRLAAEAAAKEKAEAERIRREAEEAEKHAREEKRRQMEEEVRILQEKLAATKRAAEEAKAKQLEERRRMQAMVDARRKEKKVKKKKKTTTSVPSEVTPNEDEKQLGQADFEASATSIRGASPSALVASKPNSPCSPLRAIASPSRTTVKSPVMAPKSPVMAPKSPVMAPKSPIAASLRRFVSKSPMKPSSPVKSHQPVVSCPPPAPKAASVPSAPKVSSAPPAPKVASPPAAPKVSVVSSPMEAPKSGANTGNTEYYTADQLRNQSVPGLDYKNREKYLHPDEFQQIFGMTPAEFAGLPKWKQTNMKRKKKLF